MRIVLLVFLSTFATALAVSGVAVHSTHQYLADSISLEYPAALERASARLHGRMQAEPDLAGALAAPESPLRSELAERLSAEPPPRGSVFYLVDALGRVVIGPVPPVGDPPADLHLEPLLDGEPGSVREYTNGAGHHAIGAALPLERDGLRLVIEADFEDAFSPVLSVVSRTFVINLVIIILFGVLAYRIARAVVTPVEALSEAARRIAEGNLHTEVPEASSNDEIGFLTRVFNDMIARLRRYQSEIETANLRLRDRNAELQQAKEDFEQLSITDGLTKLHNHRFFQEQLKRELKRVSRVGEPLSILLVDIDDFKGLNDRLGHAAGDELLAGLARVMNDSIRDSDLLARYGGEEFVVLAPNTDLEGAYRLGEKIRTAIAESSFILDESLRPTRATVSIGAASYSGDHRRFFQQADRALYRAKAMGKNCVVMADDSEG